MICSIKTRQGIKRVEDKEKGNEYKTVTNMVHINPIISIITLNVNGLNRLVKRVDKKIKAVYKKLTLNIKDKLIKSQGIDKNLPC